MRLNDMGRDGVRLGVIIVLGLAGIPFIQGITDAHLDLYHGLGWLQAGFTVIAVALIALAVAIPARQEAGARRRELVAVLAVALVWRAVAFVAPPHLSLDAFRYTWDAHLLLHGVSPYTHVPDDPALTALRDPVVWPILTWRTVPTLYPPGAQALFVLAGLVAPLNIWSLKAAILLCDLGVIGLTLLLLRRADLDLRRVAIYALSPLPVIEFAGNAHVDALAIAATLSAIVLARSEHLRGHRTLAGMALGVATLTKLYPLLFAVVLIRRRDWGFLAGLGGTIAVGYLAILPLGIGGGGFLGTYFRQRFVDEGLLQHYLGLVVADGMHGSSTVLSLAEGCLILAGCALVAWWRQHRGLDVPHGILAISAVWLLLSPHIFPWYVAALLPPLALTLRLPGEGGAALGWGFGLFTLMMPFTYVLFAPNSGYNANWYELWFLLPLAVMVAPLLWARYHRRIFAKGSSDALIDLVD